MDISTISGLGVALVALVVSLYMDGGTLASLWKASAFILIMGGTVGATMIAYPIEEIATLPELIGQTFKKQNLGAVKVIDRVVALVEKARREGLLTLQNEISDQDDAFLVRGIELVVDGTDPQAVRSIMETDIAFMEKRHKAGASILETAGGFAPTMGIIGTVVGLVHVLSNLSTPDKMAESIAVAFLATFYGIFTANIFWLPLAGKLKAKSQGEILLRELILEGVLSLQAGESPRIVREKLEVFLPPRLKAKEAKAEKGGEE